MSTTLEKSTAIPSRKPLMLTSIISACALSLYFLIDSGVNSIVLAVLIMVILSMVRVPVVLALILSALAGGIYSGMPMETIVSEFSEGLGDGASIALAMASLGAFAVALSRAGIATKISSAMLKIVEENTSASVKKIKWSVYGILVVFGILSQTIVPVHIAFIPLIIPPLLLIFNKLNLDRRIIGCVICFGIIVTYFVIPVGYGAVYLNDILVASINAAGEALSFEVTPDMAPKALLIPALGMLVGLLIAIFFTYRKNRTYKDIEFDSKPLEVRKLSSLQKAMVTSAVIATVTVQLVTGSMIFGSIAGFSLLALSGIMNWSEQDTIFDQGMRMMAMIGFVMVAAAGFAAVMRATGDIPALVQQTADIIGNSRGLAALVMLLVGLTITMGIGSSFSTVPIIASVFVPMGLDYGFSPMAIIALIGTAGALGDAGSPASDSTLGPTAGLDADGQHNHIWDTVVPTFIHFNIPLIIFGWIAAMIL